MSEQHDRARALEDADGCIHALIRREVARQENGLELIASENFVSRAVLEAMGSVLTNKYAEGYPGRRYYGGCEVVDEIEQLAIDRALELFGADHANVQAHSGSQANMAAYLAVLEPGDTIMGMKLPHGGHLTHGSPVNASGRLFHAVQYGVNEVTGLIDLDQVREVARAERPKLIISGGSAYPRTIDFASFAEIAQEVEAKLLVDMAHIAGLVAAEVIPSPVPHADVVTSTTHKTLRGPRGGFILCREELAKAVDKQVFPGTQGGPLEHVIAAKAVAFLEALQPAFRLYAAQVVKNAVVLGETLIEHGRTLVSGGTDTHLLLVDLRPQGMTGREAEEALGRVGIHVNKNTVPGDPRSPFVTSGIRVGTSALTTRGMMEDEMRRVAGFIDAVLRAPDDGTVARIGAEVRDLAGAFPLYRAAAAAAG
ncbi:MAG: serine hydroxymethyltransferase [Gemmatimonadales bacterium]|nr:serine hydroxymethyltransferase [Gemmatimonadales bacterium]NIN10822.1 serine hydroxymethyltransferase [Gemmatimonadales bacterium]NIN49465.1 serine hydroxymethyltransferase [Gemmatimonadales bacterium]NIP06929.1 serine hydroxymethyltransferase [Gemmatimonadales bacterium]NIR01605.1 serine hydroxymethyltransferase [Gemmatimonadales bacterium]